MQWHQGQRNTGHSTGASPSLYDYRTQEMMGCRYDCQLERVLLHLGYSHRPLCCTCDKSCHNDAGDIRIPALFHRLTRPKGTCSSR